MMFKPQLRRTRININIYLLCSHAPQFLLCTATRLLILQQYLMPCSLPSECKLSWKPNGIYNRHYDKACCKLRLPNIFRPRIELAKHCWTIRMRYFCLSNISRLVVILVANLTWWSTVCRLLNYDRTFWIMIAEWLTTSHYSFSVAACDPVIVRNNQPGNAFKQKNTFSY